MKRIIAYAGLSDGPAYYRSALPARHLGDELLTQHDIKLDLAHNIMEVRPDSANAVLVHRIFAETAVVHFAMLRKHKVKVLWDTDDACDIIPSWSTIRYDPSTIHLYDAIQGVADVKWASTDELARRIEADRVLPNLIDPEPFDMIQKREVPPGRRVQILWYGSATHRGDLELIEEPLRQIIEKYKQKIRLTFWGDSLPALVRDYFGTYVQTLEAIPAGSFYGQLKTLQPDICLAPLADHPFNRCKSNIKWLESTLAGAAVIASNIEPYRNSILDGMTGCLCQNSDQWVDALSAMIEDVQGRKTIASQAEQVVRESWTWKSELRNLWIDAFVHSVQG
jgi:glycosyltransferase involved in cell wall biosynthesis